MKKGRDYIGVSVGALIFNDNGEILLCKRSQLATNERGSWEAPGGGVEFGETREAAIKREMKEELGIDIEVLEVLHVSDELLEKDKQHWVPTTYITKIIAGQTPQIMEPHKCDEIGWFSLDKLPEPLSMITQIDVAAYKKKVASQNVEPLGVCIIVLNNKNQVLLGKRKNAYKAGTYGVPGGRIELTESLVDCGKRELLEETGLQAVTMRYLGSVREFQKNYNFIHFVFVCKRFTGIVTTMEPEKCEKWEWYDLDKLPKQLLRGHLAAIELMINPKHKVKDLL